MGDAEQTTETDDTLKATFLAELDPDRRWDLLVELHERGWAYRPFNHVEPFARRRNSAPGELQGSSNLEVGDGR